MSPEVQSFPHLKPYYPAPAEVVKTGDTGWLHNEIDGHLVSINVPESLTSKSLKDFHNTSHYKYSTERWPLVFRSDSKPKTDQPVSEQATTQHYPTCKEKLQVTACTGTCATVGAGAGLGCAVLSCPGLGGAYCVGSFMGSFAGAILGFSTGRCCTAKN